MVFSPVVLGCFVYFFLDERVGENLIYIISSFV